MNILVKMEKEDDEPVVISIPMNHCYVVDTNVIAVSAWWLWKNGYLESPTEHGFALLECDLLHFEEEVTVWEMAEEYEDEE